MKGTITALMLMMTCGVAVAADFPEPLPAETVPNVLALPESYPKTWIFAHDANFFSLVDGKVVILDVAAQTRQYKGQIGAGQFATFLQATTRPELYVAETFYSRRIRGERTDAITIYDTASLQFKDEIILPGGKRGQSVTQKNSFRFTDGERLGLIFNFTPAASVTIVDLPARAVLNEIQIPGCSLIYPTGQRGFSTLCGNGKMVSFVLDEAGREAGRYETEAFNDIDGDPLFMKAARIGGVSYFVSFKGRVQPVDLSGARAKVKKA
ncbi:MAG: amine dehydrogenase, partial [Alphaproteobacteria bacterium]